MKRWFFPSLAGFLLTTAAALAAEPAVAAPVEPAGPGAPDFLEHLVDSVLTLFHVGSGGNTVVHYAISLLMLGIALLARRIVDRVIFPVLRRLASKTETTLDDKLFPALESPTSAFVTLTGLFAALKVLKLSEQADHYISNGSRVAFLLVLFWGLWRAFSAVLDHAGEVARERQLGIATFMPWIRKTLMSLFVIFGVLLTIQSLGFDVKALLAGLGIGGLAFAFAAQDTLANVFGAMVVAVDQPFKIGETVKIGPNTGTVEDMGLRSTRIRLLDQSLMTIPNKTVAAETITNLSRFTRRRNEQVIGLSYASRPEQLEAVVADIRGLITAESDVDASTVMVYCRDLNASSIDLWIVYIVRDADFNRFLTLKQRLNLAILRTVAARGLELAFPTQTIHVASLPERPAPGARG